jgi:hypothetical protein
VLVNGAAADHNRWAPVLPALQERFTACARSIREYVFDPARFGDLDVPTLYLQGGDSIEPFRRPARRCERL